METKQAIDMFIASKAAKGLSERTIEFYRSDLNRYAQVFPELPDDAFKIEAFIGAIKGTQETRHGYYRAIRVLYNWLEKRLQVFNPMKLVEAPRLRPKVMATLEVADLNLLLLFLDNKTPRDKALLTLLLDTGIRASELASLRSQDIFRDYIVVDGKTGAGKVPISPMTQESLILLKPNHDGYIFYGQHGKLTRSGVYRVVRKSLQQIGITGSKLGSHRLRHSFGRHFLANGGDIRSLQRILRHSSIKTTERYASLADSEVAEKHRQFTPLRRVYA